MAVVSVSKPGVAFPAWRVVPVASLVPYANNARVHSAEQIGQIAASIVKFGFTNPVLVDDACGIIAGHGRVLAAQSLGLASVPVLALSHLSAVQRQAYVIADNKLALLAGWDDGLLAAELGALAGAGFDLSVIGFSGDELADLLAADDEGLLSVGDGAGSLAARFGVPPFSVLDAGVDWWVGRSAEWLALGLS